MKDKTLVGGIVVMIVGAIFIGLIWFFFLNAQTPTAPITAIPITIVGDKSDFTIFELVSSESLVSFSIDETLRGAATTAVGSSHEVAGQIAVDFNNPANTQIGPILINARTLQTDNEFRNNSIQSFILSTAVYEFITFAPTKISGLPATFTANEPISLQIEGDLTIKDVTQTAVFSATITPNSTQLSGSATAQILLANFNLLIPDASGVANVSNEATLTIDFFAKPISDSETK
ncbi:MAG: YceI family protein [Chloroflexi bacterium]|nr:YceI family protein [Chloroflexota bacterium]